MEKAKIEFKANFLVFGVCVIDIGCVANATLYKFGFSGFSVCGEHHNGCGEHHAIYCVLTCSFGPIDYFWRASLLVVHNFLLNNNGC